MIRLIPQSARPSRCKHQVNDELYDSVYMLLSKANTCIYYIFGVFGVLHVLYNVTDSYISLFQEYFFSMLSQLHIKGERGELSKQIQPAVVERLLHSNDATQIVSTFPTSRYGGSISRYLFPTINYWFVKSYLLQFRALMTSMFVSALFPVISC